VNSCFYDSNQCGAYVFTGEPSISCSGTAAYISTIHQKAVSIIIGCGFPLGIIVKVLQLKRRGSLNAESQYFPLFQVRLGEETFVTS